MSSSVSNSVPLSISTTVSVGECDVPIDIEEIAVSTMSAPASIPLRREATERPVVACEWISTGRSHAFLIFVTRS